MTKLRIAPYYYQNLTQFLNFLGNQNRLNSTDMAKMWWSTAMALIRRYFISSEILNFGGK